MVMHSPCYVARTATREFHVLMRVAINYLKLLMGRPLQRMKQIVGCSEIQHLRNCGSYVRSNKGPARWHRPFNLSI